MKNMSNMCRIAYFLILMLISELCIAGAASGNIGCNNCRNFKGQELERTFLKKLNAQKHETFKRVSKGRNKSMDNPILQLSLDSAHMAALFSISNTRVRIESNLDTLNTITMDVGDASVDTQYWDIPAFDIATSSATQSIDIIDNPFQALYPNSNYVFKTINASPGDDVYSHYTMTSETLTQDGIGAENQGSPFIFDLFETEAFLPIEFGWEISEVVTTYWDFDPNIDSSISKKVLVLDATGILTPINEDSVPAIIAFVTVDQKRYKDGTVVDSGFTDSFVWFTAEGHMLTGILKDHAETEGETEFVKFIYEKNIIACPPNQDLGLDLYPGTYRAQNQIRSGANLTQGPIHFVAGNEIELKNGFATNGELNLMIDSDPCSL